MAEVSGEFCLETARLLLREWREADRDAMYAMGRDKDVMRHLGPLQSRAESDAGINRMIACQARHGHCFWALERKSDSALLGFCGLKRIDAEPFPDCGSAEIGWRLRPEVWGKGYAKEAAIASLDFAFDIINEPMVTAFTTPSNEASWGLMERLGMERRADLDYFDNKWGPIVGKEIVYRISALQWAQHRKEFTA